MLALAVAKDFDVVKGLSQIFQPCMIMPIMNRSHLEGVEETLICRAISTIPLSIHTTLNTRGFH